MQLLHPCTAGTERDLDSLLTAALVPKEGAESLGILHLTQSSGLN